MLKTLKPAAGFSISIPGDIGGHGAVSTPHDAGPVFEAFAGFLTGVERSGQYHAASRAPAAGAQAQALHPLVDDRNLVIGASARPFVPPPATSPAWRGSDTNTRFRSVWRGGIIRKLDTLRRRLPWVNR